MFLVGVFAFLQARVDKGVSNKNAGISVDMGVSDETGSSAFTIGTGILDLLVGIDCGVGIDGDAVPTGRAILEVLNRGVTGSFRVLTFADFPKDVVGVCVGLSSVGAGVMIVTTVGFTVATVFICLERP